MRILLLIVLGLGLIFFGCVSGDTADVKARLNESFSLKINQSAYIESENMLIYFTNVSHDSRCPSDVQCVWAGRIIIHLKVSKQTQDTGSMAALVLATENNTATFTDSSNNSYSVEMIKVDPYPISTKTIDPAEYVVKLKVSKSS